MGSFSGLGIVLSLVFGFILMGLIAEFYYLLWWKKRKLYSTDIKTENLEKPTFPWCWRKANFVRGELTNSLRNEFEQEDVEMGAPKLGYGEEGIESELMRMHNLCGPPRFLFTIKEESREDLESEDGKSRTSNCRSLNDHHVYGGIDGIENPSPCFKNSNLWSGEAMTEAELNRLRSSPPPTFKFLRDAEEKFLKQEAERERGLKDKSLVQESAIAKEGNDFVKLSKPAAKSMMADQQWTIQFKSNYTSPELARNWVAKVNNELSNLPHTRAIECRRWQNQSIYKIPWSVKELCPAAYRPQMVAIGPYHHGESHLESMEEHKQRALLNFLERSEKPLQCYVNVLAVVVEDLRDAYHQLQSKWKEDDEAFLKLMILDGCFILEIMRTTTASPESLREMGYSSHDPLFSDHGKFCFVPYLKRDMLMLENQLPLLVLAKLMVAEGGDVTLDGLSKQDQLTTLILKFFSQQHDSGNNEHYRRSLHILDMYRKSLLTALPCHKSASKERNCDCLPGPGLNKEDVYVRSATELREAGIRLEQSNTRNLNDISFHKGVLRLPLVVVDDALESEYLNLMAFERFHVDAGKEVTSYVFFMDSIIDSAKDVSLLHSCGIIQNALGSDKAVSNLFNSLSRDVSLDPECSLGIVHKKVSDYCQKSLPRLLAYAKHNYFTNPWVLVSILAAIFLFALTGLQTLYTVLGYYHTN